MTIGFHELIATTPDEAYKTAHTIENLANKSQARHLLILGAQTQTLLHEEYPVFPGHSGLYTGNPNWYNKILEVFQQLGDKVTEIVNIYFFGLRNEYEQVCRGIKQVQKTKKISNEIAIEYVPWDMEEDRVTETFSKVKEEFAEVEALLQASDPSFFEDEMKGLEQFIDDEFSRIGFAIPDTMEQNMEHAELKPNNSGNEPQNNV